MPSLVLVMGWILAIFIGLLALVIIYFIFTRVINLERLISEPDGQASMSRFQFLVFTFVIAMSLFLLIVDADPMRFPKIPAEILALLGISGGSYVVSKAIQATRDTHKPEEAETKPGQGKSGGKPAKA